jgi:large subunit ribosomal protein L18
MNRQKQRRIQKQKKAWRIRSRVSTGSTRPRLSVFRSNTNIYCQVIDDAAGKTLAQASSVDKELRSDLGGLDKSGVARKVGAKLAERAKAQGVTVVAFDRGAYRYHGRVKALAEAAREGGLEF